MGMRSGVSGPVAVVPLTDVGAMTGDVAGDLEVAWKEATASSSFIGGDLLERFEQQWAEYCGVAHAIGVANGTDALELTLRGLGIGPGDEVIVPANTFIATAEAVLSAGATPRFVDVDPDTLLVTRDTVAVAITPRTAAIVVVHLYGTMPAMADIGRLAEAEHVALIEDAAQAHGATWEGRRAGSFGRAGCFSFYPSKNLGAFGDAGAVVTDDADLADRIRTLGNHGRSLHSNNVHTVVGRNSRLDALQAAVLAAKLPLLDRWNGARREAMVTYRRLLPRRIRTVGSSGGTESVHHLNVVRVADRDAVRADLLRLGIETGIHYPVPCHRQEPYRSFALGPLPVAESAADEILSLPLFPHITEQQVAYVCGCLGELTAGVDARVG